MERSIEIGARRHGMSAWRRLGLAAIVASLWGCASPPLPLSEGHLQPAPRPVRPEAIPMPVEPLILPAQEAGARDEELLTVVVNEVPLRELLFALARDSGRNIDIEPGIEGSVTLNAIDQTLEQILDRIVQLSDIRYRKEGEIIRIERDLPYLKYYSIDYLNMRRSAKAEVTIRTEVSSTGGSGGEDAGGGGNISSTEIQNTSENDLWTSLIENVQAILGVTRADAASPAAPVASQGTGEETPVEASGEGAPSPVAVSDRNEGTGAGAVVIANRESGTLAVRATAKQHAQIQRFIDKTLRQALRQVLIEATVVEVTLNDEYQAGVDWSKLAGGTGLALTQSMLGGNLATAPFFALTLNSSIQGNPLTATVRMLQQFGESRVLSSPKLMVLNNQTALLKVVDNRVYFTTSVQTDTTQGVSTTSVETEVHTVPVGFVMSVTPQVSEDKVVTLNARPTISRIVGFVRDPNPALAAAGVTSEIPEVQVREIESVLKIASGNIGIIGGLMQNTTLRDTSGLPGARKAGLFGELLGYRNNSYRKTELVIFLRPVVIDDASVATDLAAYRPYLEAGVATGRDGGPR